MTANSQLVSVKVIQSLARRGLIRLSRQSNRDRIKFTREFYKRTFDIVFSASVLILFSPLYAILAILVALSSPGPIFYAQERVGKKLSAF